MGEKMIQGVLQGETGGKVWHFVCCMRAYVGFKLYTLFKLYSHIVFCFTNKIFYMQGLSIIKSSLA